MILRPLISSKSAWIMMTEIERCTVRKYLTLKEKASLVTENWDFGNNHTGFVTTYAENMQNQLAVFKVFLHSTIQFCPSPPLMFYSSNKMPMKKSISVFRSFQYTKQQAEMC